jgi:hypothetical protein
VAREALSLSQGYIGQDQEEESLLVGTAVNASSSDDAMGNCRHFPTVFFICLPITLYLLTSIN